MPGGTFEHLPSPRTPSLIAPALLDECRNPTPASRHRHLGFSHHPILPPTLRGPQLKHARRTLEPEGLRRELVASRGARSLAVEAQRRELAVVFADEPDASRSPANGLVETDPHAEVERGHERLNRPRAPSTRGTRVGTRRRTTPNLHRRADAERICRKLRRLGRPAEPPPPPLEPSPTPAAGSAVRFSPRPPPPAPLATAGSASGASLARRRSRAYCGDCNLGAASNADGSKASPPSSSHPSASATDANISETSHTLAHSASDSARGGACTVTRCAEDAIGEQAPVAEDAGRRHSWRREAERGPREVARDDLGAMVRVDDDARGQERGGPARAGQLGEGDASVAVVAVVVGVLVVCVGRLGASVVDERDASRGSVDVGGVLCGLAGAEGTFGERFGGRMRDPGARRI